MTRSRRGLGAAFFLPALALAASLQTDLIGAASAQSSSVTVPAYRQLSASEPMAAAGISGTDYSANPPSLDGLSLLATIPSSATPRRGYFIQAQCTAGLTVVLDDAAGSSTTTLIMLAGSSINGGQGGSLDMSGMPHTGRIRIYSTSSTCQLAARSW